MSVFYLYQYRLGNYRGPDHDIFVSVVYTETEAIEWERSFKGDPEYSGYFVEYLKAENDLPENPTDAFDLCDKIKGG